MVEVFTYNVLHGQQGFTQSEMSTISNCAKKWYWLYNQLLKKKGTFSWALLVGTAIHTAFEELYSTGGEVFNEPRFVYPEDVILTPSQYEEEAYWLALVKVMVETYRIYYKDDFTKFIIPEGGNEYEAEYEWEGILLRAKIDLRLKPSTKDGSYVMDHKTFSRLQKDLVAGWDFRFQFMFYLWLVWKLKLEPDLRGFIINGIKKTELRRKSHGTEPVPEFMARVKQDMIIEPEKYFYREQLPMTSEALEHFEDIVLRPKIDRIELLRDPNTPQHILRPLAFDMNTDYCQQYGAPCQFMDLCRHGYKKFGFQYIQRPSKHEELGALEAE